MRPGSTFGKVVHDRLQIPDVRRHVRPQVRAMCLALAGTEDLRRRLVCMQHTPLQYFLMTTRFQFDGRPVRVDRFTQRSHLFAREQFVAPAELLTLKDRDLLRQLVDVGLPAIRLLLLLRTVCQNPRHRGSETGYVAGEPTSWTRRDRA